MARTLAQSLLDGDRALALRLAKQLLKPANDNFVERPWGGRRMAAFKFGAEAPANGKRIGESFELAADDSDPEARQYPSIVRLEDGSEITLPRLLEAHADVLLGTAFVARYGRRFPLLPKFLDIAELLSVQGHPEGNTEVYVIVAADEGATIRLGFGADADGPALAERLAAGRREQQRLLDLCGTSVTPQQLQDTLHPWLAQRRGDVSLLERDVAPHLGGRWSEAVPILRGLHDLYWHVLDSMNALTVRPGQVINNANPPRITAASGKKQSAEAHALGNPERREILALEIRRPGVTFRAWDNVRFPLRDIDVDAAVGSMNLERTTPADFIVEPEAVRGRPGVWRSVVSEHFAIEHLEPTELTAVTVPKSPPHCLHVLDGAASVYATDGVLVGRLARGESAIVPIGVGAYRVAADSERAAIVKVDVPVDD